MTSALMGEPVTVKPYQVEEALARHRARMEAKDA